MAAESKQNDQAMRGKRRGHLSARGTENDDKSSDANNNATIDKKINSPKRGVTASRSKSRDKSSDRMIDAEEQMALDSSNPGEVLNQDDEIVVTVSASGDEFESEFEQDEEDEEENLDIPRDEVVKGDQVQTDAHRVVNRTDRTDILNESFYAGSEIVFNPRQLIQDDPDVQQMVQEMVEKRVAQEMKNYEESLVVKHREPRPRTTPTTSTPHRRVSKTPIREGNRSTVNSPVKSPSDTTIYRPTLRKGENDAN